MRCGVGFSLSAFRFWPFSSSVRYLLAILCGLAVVAAQLLYGGAMRPVFALPAFALIGGVGILAVVGVFGRNLPAPNGSCVVAVGLFGAWLLWREMEATEVWLASGYLRLTLACLIMYGVFAWVLINPFHRLAFCVMVLASALGQAALGAWQFTHAHEGFPLPWMSEQLKLWYAGRFSNLAHGLYLNRNHLAWFLNAAGLLGLSLGCWSRWGLKTKILCLYVALMALAVAVMTGSRGGILGLVAGLGVFFIASGMVLIVGARGRRRLALGIMTAGLLIAGSGIFLVVENSFFVQNRMQILLEDSYRGYVFDAGLRQFQLEPLLGTGPGSFAYFSRQFRETQALFDDVYAHDDWLQLAADFGFPALALLVIAVILHAANGWRGLLTALRTRMGGSSQPQSHSAALLIAALSCLAAFGVHSAFDFNMQIPANALLAAACMGILANSGVEERRREGAAGFFWRLPGFLVLGGMGCWLTWEVWQAAEPEYETLQAENAVLQGDWEAGLVHTEKGQRTGQTNPSLHEMRGTALLLRSYSRSTLAERWADRRDAVGALSTAVILAPLDWRRRLQRLEALMRTGQLQEAAAEAFVTMALNPAHGRAYELYSEILEARGEFSEALRFYTLSRACPGGAWSQSRAADLTKKARAEVEAREKVLP